MDLPLYLTLTCSVVSNFVILKYPQAASSGWQLHPLNFSVCISGTSDPLMAGWVTSSGRDFLRTEQETIICSRRQSFTSPPCTSKVFHWYTAALVKSSTGRQAQGSLLHFSPPLPLPNTISPSPHTQQSAELASTFLPLAYVSFVLGADVGIVTQLLSMQQTTKPVVKHRTSNATEKKG